MHRFQCAVHTTGFLFLHRKHVLRVPYGHYYPIFIITRQCTRRSKRPRPQRRRRLEGAGVMQGRKRRRGKNKKHIVCSSNKTNVRSFCSCFGWCTSVCDCNNHVLRVTVQVCVKPHCIVCIVSARERERERHPGGLSSALVFVCLPEREARRRRRRRRRRVQTADQRRWPRKLRAQGSSIRRRRA
jgi:hypothetical protein